MNFHDAPGNHLAHNGRARSPGSPSSSSSYTKTKRRPPEQGPIGRPRRVHSRSRSPRHQTQGGDNGDYQTWQNLPRKNLEINKDLMSLHKGQADVYAILSFCKQRLPEFNKINSITALEKIAKSKKGVQPSIGTNPIFRELLATLNEPASLRLVCFEAISSLAWSLAKIAERSRNRPALIESLALVSKEVVERDTISLATTDSAASIFWAFAKFNLVHADRAIQRLEDVVVNMSAAQLCGTTAYSLGYLVWSYMRLNRRDPLPLMNRIKEEIMLRGSAKFEGHSFANVAWGFSRLGGDEGREVVSMLCLDLGQDHLEQLNPQQLAMTAWALERLGTQAAIRILERIAVEVDKRDITDDRTHHFAEGTLVSLLHAMTKWVKCRCGSAVQKLHREILNRNFSKFDTPQLSQLASTIAKPNSRDQKETVEEVLKALCEEIRRRGLSDFRPAQLCEVAVAFAELPRSSPNAHDAWNLIGNEFVRVGFRNLQVDGLARVGASLPRFAPALGAELCTGLLDQIGKQVADTSPKKFQMYGLLKLLWAFAMFPSEGGKQATRNVCKALSQKEALRKAEDVCILFWACTELLGSEAKWLAKEVCHPVMQKLSYLGAEHIVCMACALARLAAMPDGLKGIEDLPKLLCQQVLWKGLSSFSSLQFVCFAWAIARFDAVTTMEIMEKVCVEALNRSRNDFTLHDMSILGGAFSRWQFQLDAMNGELTRETDSITDKGIQRVIQNYVECTLQKDLQQCSSLDLSHLLSIFVHLPKCDLENSILQVGDEVMRRGFDLFQLSELAVCFFAFIKSNVEGSESVIVAVSEEIGLKRRPFEDVDASTLCVLAWCCSRRPEPIATGILRDVGAELIIRGLFATIGTEELPLFGWAFTHIMREDAASRKDACDLVGYIQQEVRRRGTEKFRAHGLCIFAWTFAKLKLMDDMMHKALCEEASWQLGLRHTDAGRDVDEIFRSLANIVASDSKSMKAWVDNYQMLIECWVEDLLDGIVPSVIAKGRESALCATELLTRVPSDARQDAIVPVRETSSSAVCSSTAITSSSAACGSTAMGSRHAVIIAPAYPDLEKVRSLMENKLNASKTYEYQSSDCLSQLAGKQLSDQDLLVVYMYGWGQVRDKSFEFLLREHDSDWISGVEISDSLQATQAGKQVLIMDICWRSNGSSTSVDHAAFSQALRACFSAVSFVFASARDLEAGEKTLTETFIEVGNGLADLQIGPLGAMDLVASVMKDHKVARPTFLAGAAESFYLFGSKGSMSKVSPNGKHSAANSSFMKEATQALKSEMSAVRAAAAFELGSRMGSRNQTVATALTKLLRDPDADVRREAAFALGRTARGTDPLAKNALLLALEDGSDPRVRQQAADSLRRIYRKDAAEPEVIKALSARLQCDGDAHVRRDIVHAVVEISKPGDEQAIMALVQHLQDPDHDVRELAAHGLGRVATPKHSVALAALLCHRTTDSDKIVQGAITQAIRKVYRGDPFAAFFRKLEEREAEIHLLEEQLARPAKAARQYAIVDDI